MQLRTRRTLGFWFVVGDLVAVAAAWLGAYVLRFNSGLLPIHREVPDWALCRDQLPIVLFSAVLAYRFAGLYHVVRLRRFREELAVVLQGTVLLVLFVMAMIFYQQNAYVSRAAMLLFFGLAASFVLTFRRLSWLTLGRLRRRGYNQSFAVIVGTGKIARRTALAIKQSSWTGIKNLGFIEDRLTRWNTDLDILGTTADLPRLAEKYRIEHVFVALPMKRFHEARAVFELLGQSQTPIDLRLVADLPALSGARLTTAHLNGLPVIGLRENPHDGVNRFVKRFMDVTLAGIGLILLAPLMLSIAALVRATSRGPVFYRQERCSLGGRSFAMLKFRTMRADAESQTGPIWTRINDDRRTPIGPFLRRTSLDELPQLLNVLKGDMSLVGPRPERPIFIEQFRHTIPNYMARHGVKCGITGWAQVHGWRGNTSLRKRIQYDLYYITHWNPFLDLRILVMTVAKMLFHRHAY